MSGGDTMKIKKQEFIDLYLNNENKVLAKKYGVSVQTIITWAKKLGVSKRRKKQVQFID